MRKFLTAPLIALALFVSAISFAPSAQATVCMGMDLTGEALANCQASEAGNAAVTPGYDANAIQTSNDSAMQAQLAADKTAAAKTVIDPGGVGSGFGPIMTWIASLFAWLVGVAALTLDYAVYFTIIKMGDYVHNLTAIGLTWRILRDIGNIALIFGFLAIGISTILNTERLGWGKKMLPMLLVAAIFINFSLFFTEAVIDMSNIFATQFFTEINGGEQPTADFLQKTTIGSEGISNKIMAQVGLQTIYTKGAVKDDVFKAGNTWTIGFMSILLFIVTAFVMFSLAFILVARFVFLIFIIILAPLGFAGLAIPQLAGRAKWWWDSLFEQAITAPVLLLLLYIALAVITDTSFLTGLCIPAAGSSNTSCTADWTGYVSGNFQGFASMILTFIIAMGLLLTVIIASKRLSAVGASGASKLAGKLSFGATAWAGRSTIGWGSQRLSERFKKSGLSRAPIIGRAISGTLDRGAKASFDVRGVTVGGGLKGMGVDAGTAEKGGYRDWEKAKIKERVDYAKTLEQTKDEKTQQETEKARKEAMEKGIEATEERQKRDIRQLRARHTTDSSMSKEEKANEIADLQERHNDVLKVLKKDVASQQEKIDVIGRAPQEAYAKSLVWGPGQYFRRNPKASETILKEAKKARSEKDLDSIKHLLEEAGKKEEKKEDEPKKPDAGGH